MKTFRTALAACALSLMLAPAAQAEGGSAGQGTPPAANTEELAKQTQNPVSSLISVPFQNNWNYGSGPERRTQWVLNIQPVVPLTISENWNLVARAIFPLTYVPLGPTDSQKGSGDLSLSMFLSPRKPGKLIWGIGPQLLFPTASDTFLGSGKWGAGPTLVVLTMPGPWVMGALTSNTWSYAGDSTRTPVNLLLLQPFLNYNVPKAKGFAILTAPIISANWRAPSGQQWVVPLGGGISQTFVAGNQPMSMGFQLYYNIDRPDDAPNWNLRFQYTLLFPKK